MVIPMEVGDPLGGNQPASISERW